MNRNKVRMRWYSNDKLITPFLEIKTKSGNVGKKYIYDIKNFDITKPFTNRVIRKIMSNKNFISQHPTLLNYINPTLYCSYMRRYFLSRDKNLRVTIDYKIKYMKPFLNSSILKLKPIFEPSIVLELKYNSYVDIQKSLGFKSLPFRAERFSKYSNGIDFITQ